MVRKSNGVALGDASPTIGQVVALLEAQQRHNRNITDPAAHIGDQRRTFFTFGYNSKYYVSYSVVRDREVISRRDFCVQVPPPVCADALPSVRCSSLSLITPTPCYIPPQLLLYPLIIRTRFLVRMDMHGTSGQKTTTCQLVGMEGNPEIEARISKTFNDLLFFAESVREKKDEEGSSKQCNRTEIANLVKECSKTLLCVPTSKKSTSGFKDMHVAFVRLGLGELLAAVLRQEDAEYIGCEKKMFDEGMKCLDVRDKLVHKSKSARSYSRGAGEKSRPNVQSIVSTVLLKMCKSAGGWGCRASFTNFFCTLVYSIMQGEKCDHVDKWQISSLWELVKEETVEEASDQAKEAAGNGGKENDVRAEEAEQEADEEDEEAEEQAPSRKNRRCLFPGRSFVFHMASHGFFQQFFIRILEIFSAGGFWVLPFARAPFDESMMRSFLRGDDNLNDNSSPRVSDESDASGKDESSIGDGDGCRERKKGSSAKMPKSVLMDQVHEYLCENLEVSACGAEPPKYRNWWTNADNAKQVKELFRDPDLMKGIGGRWIQVNPHRAAVSMAFSIGNVVHSLESRGFEGITEVREKVLNVLGFLLALPAPPSDNSMSIFHEAPKPVRKARKKIERPGLTGCTEKEPECVKKNGAGHSAGSAFLSSIALREVSDSELSEVDSDEVSMRMISAVDVGANGAQGVGVSMAPQPRQSDFPTSVECSAFRKNIFETQVPLPPFVAAIGPRCFAIRDHENTEKLPRVKVFAVFSSTESKVPLIVFPAKSEVNEGKVIFRLAETPVKFDQNTAACAWSTPLHAVVVAKNFRRAKDGWFGFENRIVEGAIEAMLASKAMKRMRKDNDYVKRVFGSPEDTNETFSLWLMDTYSGGGKEPVAFQDGLDAARMVFEHALAVNTEQITPGPLWFSEDQWKKALALRTRYDCISLMIKKLGVAANESPLSFYVDLFNVRLLESILGDDSRHWDSGGCSSVCVLEVFIDDSGRISSVVRHVPSWWSARTCSEETLFVVLVAKQDCEKRSLLTLVPQVGYQEEDVIPCTSVMKGCELKKHAPLLWEKLCTTSKSKCFLPRIAPTGFLRGKKEFGKIQDWVSSQSIVSPVVPGDGACWIWALLVLVGTLPCLPQDSPTPAQKNQWSALWAPVCNRFRQMVVAVIFAVHKAFTEKYGAEKALEKLFGKNPAPCRIRWEKCVEANPDPEFDILKPLTWGYDIDLLVGCWLLGINVNVFDRTNSDAPSTLEKARVRAFHHDCSKSARVTLTGNFPSGMFTSLDTKLPAPVDGFFVDVDLTEHDGDSREFGLYDIFGFSSRGHDCIDSFVLEGVARGVLDANYAHMPRPSLFLGYENNDHYFPMLPSPVQVLAPGRKSAGGDAIFDRVNGVGSTAPVVAHLLELAAEVLLGQGTSLAGQELSAVHVCENNATFASVAQEMKQWNPELTEKGLFEANKEVLAGLSRPKNSKNMSRQCSKAGTSLAAPLKRPSKVRAEKDEPTVSVFRSKTRLLIPLRGDGVQGYFRGLSDANKRIFRVFLHSLMTMRCHQSAKQAQCKGRCAGKYGFGTFASLAMASPPAQKKIKPGQKKEAGSADAMRAVDEAGAKKKSPGEEAIWLYFRRWCTLERLVCHLCEGTKDSGLHLRACFRFSTTCAVARLWLSGDLWRAALYAHCSPNFQHTHGYLGSITATVVPSSTLERCATEDPDVYLTRKRDKNMSFPQLLVYISLQGGLGLYAVSLLAKDRFFTEYGGRVLDGPQTKALKEAGLATHVRTLDSNFRHIDGRPGDNLPIPFLVTKHMVSGGNRVSCSKDECLVILIV